MGPGFVWVDALGVRQVAHSCRAEHGVKPPSIGPVIPMATAQAHSPAALLLTSSLPWNRNSLQFNHQASLP